MRIVRRGSNKDIYIPLEDDTPELQARVEALLAVDQASWFGEVMTELCHHLDRTRMSFTSYIVRIAEEGLAQPEEYHVKLWKQRVDLIFSGVTSMPK